GPLPQACGAAGAPRQPAPLRPAVGQPALSLEARPGGIQLARGNDPPPGGGSARLRLARTAPRGPVLRLAGDGAAGAVVLLLPDLGEQLGILQCAVHPLHLGGTAAAGTGPAAPVAAGRAAGGCAGLRRWAVGRLRPARGGAQTVLRGHPGSSGARPAPPADLRLLR